MEVSGALMQDGTAAPRFADVLCAVDGSAESLAAVEQAAWMAGPGASITLLTATAAKSGDPRMSPALDPLDVQRYTEQAQRVAADAGIPSVVEVDPDGAPSQVIVEWAAGRDLLALGAPPTSVLGAVLVRGVADAAIGAFTLPMLIARTSPAGREFGGSVVVASDGGEGSEALIELAAALARDRGARVTIAHAIGPEGRSGSGPVQRQLDRLTAAGAAASAFIEPGRPAAVIEHAAQESGASLIVMGSRRPRGLSVLGSVSAHVVHGAACSVLLVPPAG